MKLVIAEKPDMGRQIADVIGATNRRDGYREGGDWCVTWCFGHMVELYAREAQGDWAIEKLPILPVRFELRPIKDDKGGTEEQIKKIRTLVQRCSEIIEATDAGPEGELIFRNLFEYLGIRRPFRRLWLNALEPEAIADAFRDLRAGSEYDNLYAAAKQREIADWLVGVNATRALTLAVGKRGGPLSLGRVQTPTLGLICNRYIEHKLFKSVPYWYLQGSSAKDGQTFIWRSAERYDRREPAEHELQTVLRSGILTVDDVDLQRKTENPPLLHDLASLQKEANARYRLSMSETQDIVQTLYMRRLIKNPRTESRYIPEVVFEKIPDRLWRYRDDPQFGRFIADLDRFAYNRRSVDDTKVKDHHALLVTDTRPSGLQENEQRVYNLILARMIEAFSPVCVADVTKVSLSCGAVRLQARGRKDVSLGWRAVMRSGDDGDVKLEDVDEIELSMKPLPHLERGERIAVGNVEMVEDQTRPKPLFSDATLLTAMENAGSTSDSKEVADALRNVGIGTAATRKEIKETLLSRKYIEEKKNRLLPTRRGMHVYNAVKDKSIASVELTARWQMALSKISAGERSADEFEQSIRKYTARVTKDILGGGEDFNRLRAFIVHEGLMCPRCQKEDPPVLSEMHLGDKSAYCPKCKFSVYRKIAGKRLSDDSMTALIRNGVTPVLSGFQTKYGPADASVTLLPDGSTHLEFQKKNKSTIHD